MGAIIVDADFFTLNLNRKRRWGWSKNSCIKGWLFGYEVTFYLWSMISHHCVGWLWGFSVKSTLLNKWISLYESFKSALLSVKYPWILRKLNGLYKLAKALHEGEREGVWMAAKKCSEDLECCVVEDLGWISLEAGTWAEQNQRQWEFAMPIDCRW